MSVWNQVLPPCYRQEKRNRKEMRLSELLIQIKYFPLIVRIASRKGTRDEEISKTRCLQNTEHLKRDPESRPVHSSGTSSAHRTKLIKGLKQESGLVQVTSLLSCTVTKRGQTPPCDPCGLSHVYLCLLCFCSSWPPSPAVPCEVWGIHNPSRSCLPAVNQQL